MSHRKQITISDILLHRGVSKYKLEDLYSAYLYFKAIAKLTSKSTIKETLQIEMDSSLKHNCSKVVIFQSGHNRMDGLSSMLKMIKKQQKMRGLQKVLQEIVEEYRASNGEIVISSLIN
jgi:hypothetical protein